MDGRTAAALPQGFRVEGRTSPPKLRKLLLLPDSTTGGNPCQWELCEPRPRAGRSPSSSPHRGGTQPAGLRGRNAKVSRGRRPETAPTPRRIPVTPWLVTGKGGPTPRGRGGRRVHPSVGDGRTVGARPSPQDLTPRDEPHPQYWVIATCDKPTFPIRHWLGHGGSTPNPELANIRSRVSREGYADTIGHAITKPGNVERRPQGSSEEAAVRGRAGLEEG